MVPMSKLVRSLDEGIYESLSREREAILKKRQRDR